MLNTLVNNIRHDASSMAAQLGVVEESPSLTKPNGPAVGLRIAAASPALRFVKGQRNATGRPPVFAPPAVMEAAARHPALSARSISDRLHAAVAEAVLKDAAGQPLPEFAWLFQGRRLGLRAEIGRMRDTKTVLAFARWACERRPATREGMQIIRRQRMGAAARPASSRELANRIVDVLNAYFRIRPKVTTKIMAKALAIAGERVAASAGENERPARRRRENENE